MSKYFGFMKEEIAFGEIKYMINGKQEPSTECGVNTRWKENTDIEWEKDVSDGVMLAVCART